jgi:hypothetical protein
MFCHSAKDRRVEVVVMALGVDLEHDFLDWKAQNG